MKLKYLFGDIPQMKRRQYGKKQDFLNPYRIKLVSLLLMFDLLLRRLVLSAELLQHVLGNRVDLLQTRLRVQLAALRL